MKSTNLSAQTFWQAHPSSHVLTMAIKQWDALWYRMSEWQLAAFRDEITEAIRWILPAPSLFSYEHEEALLLLPPLPQKQVIALLFAIDDIVHALGRRRLHQELYLSFGITPSHTTSSLPRAMHYAQSARVQDQDYIAHATSYNFYTPAMHTALQQRSALHQLLDTALLKEAFSIVLQPKINSRTQQLLGVEVLVRWYHQDKEIPLSAFLPLAQKNTCIRDIDLFIAKRSCELLTLWQREGFLLCPLSINVSKASFLDGAYYLRQLKSIVQSAHISPSLLELELSEDIPFHRQELMTPFLTQAKTYGFACSLDDFGSSQASLQALSLYSFSCVKLDQCFFRPFHKKQRQILKHCIALLKELQQPMIAEGVETLAQIHFLQECGCDAIQGYYYDAPLIPQAFQTKYLSKKITPF